MSGAQTTLPSTPVGEPPFAVGEVIAGKYSIDRVVGVGGMAIVFAAHHLELDQPVALKVLLPEHATNADLLRRFVTEARAAAKLKSVHVARISDVVTVDSRAGKTLPIIVMELLDGRDLSTVLEQKGKITSAQALNFVLQACDAIAEAHGLGIVHRDLKPANLFLVERRDGSPIVKLLDFGISKNTAAVPTSGAQAIFGRLLAKDTQLAGTPAYMSPEQIEGRQIDHRTDIWALGVILYELVTGRDPFGADDVSTVLDQVLSTSPVPIAQVAPEVPPSVVEIVERCLQKDREKRYQNIGELTSALSEALGEMSFVSMVSGVARVGNVASVDLSMTAKPTAVDPSRKSPRKILLGALLLLGVVGIMLLAASVAVMRARTPEAEAHPPAIAPAPDSAFPPAPPIPTDEGPKPAVTTIATAATATPTATPTSTNGTKPARPPPRIPAKRPSTPPTPSSSSYHRTDW